MGSVNLGWCFYLGHDAGSHRRSFIWNSGNQDGEKRANGDLGFGFAVFGGFNLIS